MKLINEVEIKKSLNDTDIQITSEPTLDTYATTKPKRDRPLKKVRGHPCNIKSKIILPNKTAQQIIKEHASQRKKLAENKIKFTKFFHWTMFSS